MPAAVVFREIAVLLLIAFVGVIVRRIGVLDDAAVRRASRLVVDVTMPALVFTQLLETTGEAALRRQWYAPLVGAALLLVSFAIARLAAGLFAEGSRGTFVFSAGLPNWIYLPLPIAAALHGDDGVRAVLLVNVGAMLVLWSVGVWILRGSGAWRELLVNPGLLATAAALVAILAHPTLPGPPEPWSAAFQALTLIGGLTVPLSLLLTGAVIGGAPFALPSRATAGIVLVRLLIAPLAIVAVLALIAAAGWRMPAGLEAVVVLVAAMPVAISASMFAERFGGDPALGAQAILWTTPIALVTVPLVLRAAAALGL